MNRYFKLFLTIVIGLILFSLIRIALFTVYYDNFSDNSIYDIIISFIHGIRFDASIMLTIISPFILLLLMPVNSRLFHKIVMWFIFLLYMGMSIFLVVDLFYFGFVNRHFANELMLMGNEGSFVGSVIIDYALEITITLISVAVAGVFWNKFVNIDIKHIEYSKKSLIKWFISFAVISGVVFLVIRGSVGIKPISTIDAFISGSNSMGNLTLNGLFTASRYMIENDAVSKDMYNFMPEDEAKEIINKEKSAECILPEELINKKPNIVFIMLESWSAYYVDAFSGNSFGLTPNLDRMAHEGLKFNYHYTPERRSISSIQAALLGIPPMNSIPRLGFGLETVYGSGTLGTVMNKSGYDTIFIQSSKRNSFYMDVIAKSLGFKEYYGMEDLDEILDYPDRSASQFGWDYETYMKLSDTLKNKGGNNKPFFAFLFTGTTHVPYAEPNKENVKFPHNKDNENGFKNTLVYADWSLGEFIKSIEKEDFFKNTIFIITADHNLGRFEKVDFPEDYRIPLVIWSPLLKNSRQYDFVTSHVDIAPTVLHLAGAYKDRNEYIGDSIFCKDNNSYGIIYLWNSSGIISNNEWLIHSFKNILDTSPKDMNEDIKSRLSKLILAYYQESYNKIINGNKK